MTEQRDIAVLQARVEVLYCFGRVFFQQKVYETRENVQVYNSK